jgi:hypothetical protein
MSTIAGDDEAPPWLADGAPLVVDIETLEDFARVIDAEVNQNFIPYAQRVVAKLRSAGPTEPADGFLELEAALDTYYAARDRATSLLNEHAYGTMRLVEAAKFIAQRYRNADDFATVTLNDVQTGFSAPAGGLL